MKKYAPKYNTDTLAAIWKKSNGDCWYCGTTLDVGSRFSCELNQQTFVVDHVVPMFCQGETRLENLVPCCWQCNCSKGTKSIEEFRIHRARKAAGMPRFSDDQIAYLCAHGIALPPLDRYEFYFEKKGWRP